MRSTILLCLLPLLSLSSPIPSEAEDPLLARVHGMEAHLTMRQWQEGETAMKGLGLDDALKAVPEEEREAVYGMGDEWIKDKITFEALVEQLKKETPGTLRLIRPLIDSITKRAAALKEEAAMDLKEWAPLKAREVAEALVYSNSGRISPKQRNALIYSSLIDTAFRLTLTAPELRKDLLATFPEVEMMVRKVGIPVLF